MNTSRQFQIEQDRDRIDISAEHECEFWMRRFDATYTELTAAVREVGSKVSDVKGYFDGIR